MPVLKIYVHFIWSTKNRIPYLYNENIRKRVWEHIFENAKQKDIHILNVNGHADHCHCLIKLSADQTVSKVLQLIKGECSYWINKTGLIKERFPNEKFDWQNDYYGESISSSAVYAVNDYISIQEEHHKKKTFKEEFDSFFTEYNLKI